MKTYFLNSTNILTGLRFIARLLTAFIVMLIIFLLFSNNIHNKDLNPFVQAPSESIMLFSFYAALLGLLIAWKIEGLGGMLTIGSLLVFSVVNYISRGHVLWNIWILGIPAFLYLICWWYTNYSDSYDVYRQ